MNTTSLIRLCLWWVFAALLFAEQQAHSGTLTNGTLTVVIRDDNGAINNVTLGSVEFFRHGTFVSDWGLQLGSTSSTFAYNNADGGEGVPVTVTGGNVATGAYTGGGANIAVSRTYSLVSGQDALRIANTFTNNGASSVSLRYFDTFDPDQGISAGTTHSTYNDLSSLAGESVAQARISFSGKQHTVVMSILGPSDVASAGGSYFRIDSGSALNLVQSTPADGNDNLADVGLHLIADRTLAPSESVTVTALIAFGTTPAAAQAAFASYATSLPPYITVGAVTGTTTSGATLNGTVNPNGSSTNASFEYGLTSSYGSTTSSQAMGSGTSIAPLSAALTGLLANTTYHYRLVATNSGGTTTGADQTFATIALAPSVSGAGISAITTTAATLGATVNPNTAATSAYFEYGLTTSYGSSTSAQALGSGGTGVPLSASLTGLSVNTTYHFRIVATNSGGTTTGTDQTFSTLPLAPALTLGSPTAITTTGATLNAQVNPNGNATNVQFVYGTDTAYGSITSIQAVGNGSTFVPASAALTGLTPNTTYHYRALATNDGATTMGADQIFATLALPPTATTNVPTGVTSSAATLNASVNPNGTAASVRFEYGPTTAYGTSTSTQAIGSGSSASAVTAVLSGLGANTTYHFRVVATNSGGTTNGADQAFSTLSLPPAVFDSGVSALSTSGVSLCAVVLPNGGATSAYFEYGTSNSYGAQSPSQSLGAGQVALDARAVLSGLPPSTTYHYRVVAANPGGTTSSADATFTTGNLFFARRASNYFQIQEVADQGGRLQSSSSYSVDSSIGEIGGVSSVAAPLEKANHGFIGELADITGMQVSATPATINETSTRRISSTGTFDDATTTMLLPTEVAWGMTGPLASLATGGLGTGNHADQYLEATAGVVYEDTSATVTGSYGTFSGSVSLTVRNTLPDNYGSYAGDGLADTWQINYFGLNNPNATPTFDGDFDRLPNLLEFACNLNPNTSSVLPMTAVRNGANFEYVYQRSVAALGVGLQFAVQWSDSLNATDWHVTGVSQTVLSDNGTVQQVKALIPAGSATRKFARLSVSAP